MSVPLPIGVELVVDAAVAAAAPTAPAIKLAGSLSASMPAKLINVEPEGLRSVPLMVDAMLPRWVPSELRGLEPRAVLNAKLFMPAFDALRAA